MKSSLTFALRVTGFSLALFASLLKAEDWTTTDGKVYHNVAVVKTAPDAVTIVHQDGGALVPLAKLPPDIQKRYSYDPAAAKVAAVARSMAEAKNAEALKAELAQALVRRQALLISQDPRIPTPDPSVDSNVATASTDSSTSGEGLLTGGSTISNHHSTSELVDVTQRLKYDHPDLNHRTMANLLLNSHYLGPDNSDPNRHTMDELASGAHAMVTPPPDSTHHTTEQLLDGTP